MTPLDWLAATDFTLPLAGICLCLAVLFIVWSIREHGRVEVLPRVDQRMTPEERQISLSDADDYFHGTGAFRLRLHELRRQRAAEKRAAATGERPAA